MAPFSRGKVVLAAVTAAALVPLSASASAATRANVPACSSGTLVHTRSGPVCGVTRKGQTDYLDIRYAAPPVGTLRWAPPQPMTPWTTTYRATRRGPSCAQPTFPSGKLMKGTTEDCLFLEVQEPAEVKAGAKLPVMVEMHGGGFLGEFRDDDGTNLIDSGRVIYVYVGYRLGIFGFLADQALGAHSGDYGLMDQQAALRWVKDNIARFGGNPGNVTAFGESAGGASVCDLVASPTARGLFQKGISISGFYNYNVNTIWSPADCKTKLATEAQAQQAGATFTAKVGCANAPAVATCLRGLPPSKLTQNAGTYESPLSGGTIGPIANGTTLPVSAAEAFKAGHVNQVKLMIGVGEDEFNGGVYTNGPATVVANTNAEYRSLVRRQFGTFAPKVMKLYPPRHFASPSSFIAYRTIMADGFSVCPALTADQQLAGHIPVYAYEDDDTDSPTEATNPPLGAYHSAINRLVHDVPSTLDQDQLVLQNQTLAQWTGFAATGNPNAASTPPWTTYRAHGGPVMSLQAGGASQMVPTATVAAEHHCSFWDTVDRNAPWSVNG